MTVYKVNCYVKGHQGGSQCPDCISVTDKLRSEAQKRGHEQLIRKLIFKARDLSEGIAKCETPAEMASAYEYIRRDAEELAYIIADFQGLESAPSPVVNKDEGLERAE